MASPARHASALPARRSALRLWIRTRRRRRATSTRVRRRGILRRYGLAWWTVRVAAVLFVAAVGYLAVTTLMIRAQVSDLQRALGTMQQSVQAGDLTAAQQAALSVGPPAARAHDLTRGPVWAGAAALPWVGSPFDSVRTTTTAVDRLARDVVPQLTGIADDIDPQRLRPDGRSVDVATLQRIAPTLHSASTAADAIQRTMSGAPAHTWLPAVDGARATVGSAVDRLAGVLRGADQAAAVAPGLLGVDGTRKYFVAFQNEAELRGTGGLPGAFAILSATKGRITFERFESDTVLLSYRPDQQIPTGLDFGPDYARMWDGSDPTTFYVNSNLSAHFPYAAQTWVAMWQKVSGEKLDGAMALDPTALSYLLAATGPAKLADGTEVSADNVVALTQRDAYARFPATLAGDTARKQWLVEVTEAAEEQLVSGRGDPARMADALAKGIGERRLLAWSSHPDVQAALERTPAAGSVAESGDPYAGVVLNNAAAGKLDFYLHRSVDYQRTGCGDTRDVRATVELTNTAPASGLPELVVGRLDDDAAKARPGDSRTLFDYIATDGAVLKSLTVNGRTVPAARFVERGHPVYRVDVELPRGTTVEVVVHLSEPAGRGAPTVMVPPGVNPVDVTVNDQRCS